jgi:peptidoglycan/xylan/chitin deacetylase (PgdA/CDA1 family)
VLTFGELADAQTDRRPTIILSFDDGYRDFVEYAMPILAQHGLRANQNVIAQSVETGQPPWMIRLVDALNAAPVSRLRKLAIPGLQVPSDDYDELAKTIYGTQLTASLQVLTPEERTRRFEDLENLLADTEPDRFTPMMSHRDVTEVQSVHELGAHSYSHEAMARFSETEFSRDVDRCQQLFTELSVPMKIFAFPYGSFRAEQVGVLHNRDVEHVLLVGERPSRIGQGVYTRITMYGDSSSELRMRALGHRLGQARHGGE